MSKQSVVIADDHELMREGIRSLLEQTGRFEIVAAVADGKTALTEVLERRPDLAVLDASMPGRSGVAVIGEISKESVATSCVLISMFDHAHLIAEAIEAGAGACVSKKDAAADLIAAIDSLEDDGFFVSRSLAERWNRLRKGDPFVPLSGREKEVMHGVVEGASNKQIADALELSVRTVDHHRERLMRKIGARNAADIVRYAARKGEI